MMVLNYCLVDIFFVLLDIVFYFILVYILRFMNSYLFCELLVFFDSLFKVVLILSMSGIVIDRYINLVRFFRKKMIKK